MSLFLMTRRTMNNQTFLNLEMIGETIVVLAAALWITHIEWIPYVFCIGAIFAAVGRFGSVQQTGDNLTLKRLFRMRKWAMVFLLVSAALMFVKGTHYVGYEMYLFPSSWLIFFAIFAVIEVYTTVRILYITKEK